MAESILKSFEVWTAVQGLKSKGRVKSIDNISLEGIENLRNLVIGLSLIGKFTKNSVKLPDTIGRDILKAKAAYYKSLKKKPCDFKFGPPLLREFALPEGWKWMRVGELCDLQTGATPSTLKSEYYGGEIRWLVSGDINRGTIYDCEGRITNEGLKNSNCKILPKDTVLIALNGQGKTRASVALLKVEAACNQSLVGIIPFSFRILDPQFLKLALHYRYYEIREITGQKQRRGLNMGLVNELSIPLPPLAEQHRIVAKVDELMALCDQLEEVQTTNLKTHQALVKTLLQTLTEAANADELHEAWQRMAPHFDTLFCTDDSIEQLKQTILQLAVMGRLVKQSPTDEPATALLKRIKVEKAKLEKAGKLKKGLPAEASRRREKELPAIEADEIPFELPGGWVWCRLGEVSDFINGDRSKNYPNAHEYVSEGIAWIKTGHIEPDGTLSTSSMHYITREKFESLRSGKIAAGDLVYCLRGATIGKTAFTSQFKEGAVASSLMIIRAYEIINRWFLYYFLTSPHGKREIKKFDNGSAQPNLSANNVGYYLFPLPPLAEQQRIVAKVQQLQQQLSRLEARLQQSNTYARQLMDTVLQQAFEEKGKVYNINEEKVSMVAEM